ncbi:hypothetical protein JCM3775_005861 [Rhodotorula graminis]
MPSDPVPQPCEVCGVETVHRCSACVEAGISLFFCGKDHQKLVWPAHKTVCGPGKAHPFAVMPLTDDEATWIEHHLDDTDLEPGVTIRKQIARTSNSRQPAEMIVQDIVGGAYEQSELPDKLMLVHWLRGSLGDRDVLGRHVASARRLEECGARGYDALTGAQQCAIVFIGVAAVLGRAGLRHLAMRDATWISLLQHKALLTNRLVQLLAIGCDKDAELRELVAAARIRLFEWAATGAGSGDPRIERALTEYCEQRGRAGEL